jgi:hypothetical protein
VARTNAAHAPVLTNGGGAGGVVPRLAAMPARADAFVVGALLLELLGEGGTDDGDEAGVAVVDGEGLGRLTVDRGAAVAVPLGIGVGVLTGAGVGELGRGQTPAGEGGTEEEDWLS